jgi:predicted dinucleotide-binding enzyme
MKTAIIGLGNLGSRVATNLTAGGESIVVTERDLAKAQKFAGELGNRAEAMPIDKSIETADIIILAIWLDAIKELVTAHHAALAGKIIVDPSNPIALDGRGGFKKTIPADQSAGTIVARLLPHGASLVKAFGTVSAASLGTGAHRKPDPAVLFYATDDPDAGRAVAKLITNSGFAPIHVGGLDQSIRIEVGGDLHELGKLGKIVSVKEAQAVV